MSFEIVGKNVNIQTNCSDPLLYYPRQVLSVMSDTDQVSAYYSPYSMHFIHIHIAFLP